jgi:hypothetical protein
MPDKGKAARPVARWRCGADYSNIMATAPQPGKTSCKVGFIGSTLPEASVLHAITSEA